MSYFVHTFHRVIKGEEIQDSPIMRLTISYLVETESYKISNDGISEVISVSREDFVKCLNECTNDEVRDILQELLNQADSEIDTIYISKFSQTPKYPKEYQSKSYSAPFLTKH